MKNSFWEGKRVLITGHTGFKGSWLTLWLHELGARITGVSLEPNTNPSLFDQINIKNKIEKHYIQDICNYQRIKEIAKDCQPQVVFHLAAQPLVRLSYEDPLKTWETNVQGSLHILEAIKDLNHHCSVVMVTTDKVYENKEWDFGYRENDPLGGHDPYSASKAATELAINSWRKSFCGKNTHQTKFLFIATARAGNVIGGGDWARDRIIPDAIKCLKIGKPINVRNPSATRPWQHVLEPLGGYIRLAEILYSIKENKTGENTTCAAFNFGPNLEANKTVAELVNEAIKYWPGQWNSCRERNNNEIHEAKKLSLDISYAYHILGWQPRWNFETTVNRTMNWYKRVEEKPESAELECLADIHAYQEKNE